MKSDDSAKASRRRPASILTLIGGTSAGQVVAILVAPALARLYSPDEFGVFSLLTGIALVIASVSALRFELAILLPERDEDAFSVAWLALLTVCTTVMLTTIAALLIGSHSTGSLLPAASAPYLLTIPLLVALVGVFTILNQLAIRDQRYRTIASRNFLQQSTTALGQASFGAVGWGTPGLIFGMALGQTAGISALIRNERTRRSIALDSFRPSKLRLQARRYIRFPLVLTPAAFLNNLGQYSPVLLLGFYYGADAAGWIGLTQRVLGIPAAVIGLAVAQVYLGSLARAARERPSYCRTLFYRTSAQLAVVAVAGGITIALFAPWAFTAVFGIEWAPAGRFAQALAPFFAFQMLSSPLSQTLIVFECLSRQLLWDAFRLIAVVTPVVVCANAGQGPLVAVWAMSAGGAFAYALLWLICWTVVRRRQPSVSEPATDPQSELNAAAAADAESKGQS